jgi:hypothetical protein
MKSQLLVILSFFAFSGCAPTLSDMPSGVVIPYPFNPAGKTILIQPFYFYPELATNVDRSFVEKFGEIIAADVQNCLKKGGFRYPVVVWTEGQLKGDLLITGTIKRVSGGHATHRKLFELFGFGATKVTAVGEIIDTKTARSLVGFSFTKRSHYTWQENEAAVRENVSEIAQEIAQVIIQSQE